MRQYTLTMALLGRRGLPTFLFALVSLFSAVFPWVGFLGVVAILLAIRDLNPASGLPPSRLTFAAIALGCLATIGGFGWAIVLQEPSKPIAHGGCPRVYVFDGSQYRLDADLIAAALYPWAEQRDVVRLDHIRSVDGAYRLRIQNDREETDHLDSVSLLVVDHEENTQVLPTTKGELMAVRDAQRPIRVIDDKNGERQRWTLDFARPATSERALLILRGHSTDFAEDALFRYMATMGQGIGPLMAHAVAKADCTCSREVLAEEAELLGLPLVVTVSTGTGWVPVEAILPIGPAVARSIVVPIDLPANTDQVSIRLEATPRFWQIDKFELAPAQKSSLSAQLLKPRSATLVATEKSESVIDQITQSDHRRVKLQSTEHVDVLFDAPPTTSGARSVFVALRGYYQVPIGGKRLVNVAAVLAHRWGITSLPRFSAGLP